MGNRRKTILYETEHKFHPTPLVDKPFTIYKNVDGECWFIIRIGQKTDNIFAYPLLNKNCPVTDVKEISNSETSIGPCISDNWFKSELTWEEHNTDIDLKELTKRLSYDVDGLKDLKSEVLSLKTRLNDLIHAITCSDLDLKDYNDIPF